MTVVAVEEEAVAVEEAAAAAAAVEAAEAEAEMMMTMTMMMMTMRMRMTTVHLPSDQVHLVVADPDEGFSTIKKWNSNWPKACKINARWLREDESPASRPPIPSQPRIRMDDVLK